MLGVFSQYYLTFLFYSRVAAFAIGFLAFSYLCIALRRSRSIAVILVEVFSPCRLPLMLCDLLFDVPVEEFLVTPNTATTESESISFDASRSFIFVLVLLLLALGISWKVSWFLFLWVGFFWNTVFLLALPAITSGKPCCFLGFYLFSFLMRFHIPQMHTLKLLLPLAQLMALLLHFWQPIVLIFTPLTAFCLLDKQGRVYYNYLLWKPSFE